MHEVFNSPSTSRQEAILSLNTTDTSVSALLNMSKIVMSALSKTLLRSTRQSKIGRLILSHPVHNFSHLNPVVSISDAKLMPKHYNEMSGTVIISMAVGGNQSWLWLYLWPTVIKTVLYFNIAEILLQEIKKQEKKGL
jgi:hypothetical protein